MEVAPLKSVVITHWIIYYCTIILLLRYHHASSACFQLNKANWT